MFLIHLARLFSMDMMTKSLWIRKSNPDPGPVEAQTVWRAGVIGAEISRIGLRLQRRVAELHLRMSLTATGRGS
jgi:hypothetical protein